MASEVICQVFYNVSYVQVSTSPWYRKKLSTEDSSDVQCPDMSDHG